MLKILFLFPSLLFANPCLILDAGHGGKDPGANNSYYRLNEKDLNLDMVLRLSAALQNEKYDVYLTRTDDHFVSLDDRVILANTTACDTFVSIHHNSNNGAAEGFETYYGKDISFSFAKLFHQFWSQGMSSPNRGVKKADFHVIKDPNDIDPQHHNVLKLLGDSSKLPNNPNLKSILIELFFIDNNREVERYVGNDHLFNALLSTVREAVISKK